jgi:1-phosphofructokinase
MIYTVTLNPCLDRTITVPGLVLNEVLRATSTRLDLGGKGLNVSRALAALGVPNGPMGFLGGSTGQFVEKGLEAMGLAPDFIRINDETRTNVVVIESGSETHIKVNEPGPVISSDELERLIHKISQKAKPGDWWAFCGGLPPGVPSDIYAQLISLVHDRGGKAALDSSGEPLRLGCQEGPELVKPNQREIAEASQGTMKRRRALGLKGCSEVAADWLH